MIDKGGGGSSGGCERFAVEGALVVCTQMFEGMSQSQMTPASGIMVNGANELIHTDVEFEPKFEKCRYDYEDCEPDIEGGEWHDWSEGNQSNGGNGVLEEKSFMVCLKGYGMLYISEDGQRPSEAKRKAAKGLIKEGERELLGLLMYVIFGGDPVNMATGNFVFMRNDLEVLGRNQVVFKRFYNSIDEYVGPLGKGWYHSYDIKLTLSGERVIIRFEDGHEEKYEINKELNSAYEKDKIESTEVYRLSKPGEKLDNPDDVNYKAPDGNYNQLIRTADSYSLEQPDGRKLCFDKEGNLVEILDQNKAKTSLTYYENRLIGVVSSGISLTFTYENNRIKTVTDHVGRAVIYDYESGFLVGATDPLGNTRVYDYDHEGRFLHEINPEGNLVVENIYNEDGRITLQKFGDGSQMCYEYDDEVGTTTFTDQNGIKTVYYRDELYRTTRVEYFDGGEEQYEFNNLNQKISETDKKGNRTYYDFDEKGKIKRIKNPLNEIVELTYDEKNNLEDIKVNGMLRLHSEYDEFKNLTSTKDGLNREVKFKYDEVKRNLPTEMTKPDGSKIKLRYDDCSNMVEVTDGYGVTTGFEYDSLNRLIKRRDGNGNETRYEYDLNNNVICVTDALGAKRKFKYNKINKPIEIIDFNGGRIKFDYNNLNKPSVITDPLGRVTRLCYDKMWNVSKLIQPNGGEVNYIYDETNRLVAIEKPDKSIVEYEYDQNGNRKKVVIKAKPISEAESDKQEQSEKDNITYLKYDQLNRLIEVGADEGVHFSYEYDEYGQITRITDAMGNTVHLTYDEAGQLIQETNIMGDSRFYTYTSLGNLETVTDEANRVTRYEYELGGRLKSIYHPVGTTEHFTYDKNGNIKSYVDETGQKTTFVYDSLNRVIQVTGENGSSKCYAYNPMGNVTSITNELENTTHYEYSLTGKLTKITDSLGNETYYTYDLMDQLIEVKQSGGSESEYNSHSDVEVNETSRITTYKRNLLGQVESVIDALGNIEKYWYSSTGQLVKKMDKDGFLTKYGYTNRGDVNHIEYADGRQVFMSYNPLGQLTEINDWLGKTTIEIDSLGRATKVTNHRGEVVEYTYGKCNERRSIIYPDRKEVNYHYDEALRLTQIQDGEKFTNYIYDNYNRLIEKRYPNNTATKYGYNDFNQLQSLCHHRAEKNFKGKEVLDIMDQFYFKYDLLGNKIEENRVRIGRGIEQDNGKYEYQYDTINRLIGVFKESETLRSYQYDSFGNRTRMVEDGRRTFYTYNSLNQLILLQDHQGGVQEYLYDKRGNLSAIYKDSSLTHHHHFGALNRLESTFNYGQNKGAIYEYNGLGHRVGKIVGSSEESITKLTAFEDINLKTESYHGDVIDLTRQYHNLLARNNVEFLDTQENEFNRRYMNFLYDFGVLSFTSEEETIHYLQNDLGSPVRLTNEYGNERDVFDYDDFGNSIKPTHKNQPFGYTGYQYDSIADNYFAQARQYSPKMGRFISKDSHWNTDNMIFGDNETFSLTPLFLIGIVPDFLAIGQSNNLYAYTMNNPFTYVDLNGGFLSAIAAAAVKTVAIAAVVGGTVSAVTSGISEWRESGCWKATASSAAGGFVSGAIATGLGTAMFLATSAGGTNPAAGVIAGIATQGAFNALGIAAGYGVERLVDRALGVERDMEARNRQFGRDLLIGIASGYLLGGISAGVPKEFRSKFTKGVLELIDAFLDALLGEGVEVVIDLYDDTCTQNQ